MLGVWDWNYLAPQTAPTLPHDAFSFTVKMLNAYKPNHTSPPHLLPSLLSVPQPPTPSSLLLLLFSSVQFQHFEDIDHLVHAVFVLLVVVFVSFHLPVNSDMENMIFNVCMWSFAGLGWPWSRPTIFFFFFFLSVCTDFNSGKIPGQMQSLAPNSHPSMW